MHCKSKNKKWEKIVFTFIKCYIVGSISDRYIHCNSLQCSGYAVSSSQVSLLTP